MRSGPGRVRWSIRCLSVQFRRSVQNSRARTLGLPLASLRDRRLAALQGFGPCAALRSPARVPAVLTPDHDVLQASEETRLQVKTQHCFDTLLNIQQCTSGGVQHIAAVQQVCFQPCMHRWVQVGTLAADHLQSCVSAAAETLTAAWPHTASRDCTKLRVVC